METKEISVSLENTAKVLQSKQNQAAMSAKLDIIAREVENVSHAVLAHMEARSSSRRKQVHAKIARRCVVICKY